MYNRNRGVRICRDSKPPKPKKTIPASPPPQTFDKKPLKTRIDDASRIPAVSVIPEPPRKPSHPQPDTSTNLRRTQKPKNIFLRHPHPEHMTRSHLIHASKTRRESRHVSVIPEPPRKPSTPNPIPPRIYAGAFNLKPRQGFSPPFARCKNVASRPRNRPAHAIRSASPASTACPVSPPRDG